MSVASEVSYLRRFTVKFVEIVAAGIGTAVTGYLVAYIAAHFSLFMPAAVEPTPPQATGWHAEPRHTASIEATVRAALANHDASQAAPVVATTQPPAPASPETKQHPKPKQHLRPKNYLRTRHRRLQSPRRSLRPRSDQCRLPPPSTRRFRPSRMHGRPIRVRRAAPAVCRPPAALGYCRRSRRRPTSTCSRRSSTSSEFCSFGRNGRYAA